MKGVESTWVDETLACQDELEGSSRGRWYTKAECHDGFFILLILDSIGNKDQDAAAAVSFHVLSSSA
jgi:hypothetical protein